MAGRETKLKPTNRTERLYSIDALRGIVMILMALDHVRDYFGASGNPTNLETATTGLFLTRWITHFCAPSFVLLAGTAAWLYGSRGRSRSDLSRFLWTRGLWLIVLEVTVVNFAWLHSFGLIIWQVIGAIGASMIVLSGLIFLPTVAVLAIGIVLVAGQNLLDPIELSNVGAFAPAWRFLHEGIRWSFGFETIAGTPILVIYPLLPWIGVMAIGYGIGPLTRFDRTERRRAFLTLGTITILAFIILRSLNGYGDPVPWETQSGSGRTWLSFLNCTKYPPSLAYLLMTLGPAFLALTLLDREPSRFGRACITFGRVPLFYYLLHLHLIHVSARLFHWIRFGEPVSIIRSQFSFMSQMGFETSFPPIPPDFEPLPLEGVYLVWLLLVAALFPICAWYERLKTSSKSKWLGYL